MPNPIKKAVAEELAKRIKQGDELAMDFASRMQRAKEMGFDTDTVYYHGTTQHGMEGISKEGFDVDTYSGKGGYLLGKGVYLTPSKQYAARYGSRFHNYTKDTLPEVGKMVGKDKKLVIPTFVKKGAIAGDAFDGKEILVADPSNIRSINAAFDPAKKESANLLASKGAGFVPFTAGAAATMAGLTPEQAQAMEQAKIDSLYGIGGALENRIQAPDSPLLNRLADVITDVDRRTTGHPANILVPTGLGDWARKAAYSEADWEDRVLGAADILP